MGVCRKCGVFEHANYGALSRIGVHERVLAKMNVIELLFRLKYHT